MKKKLIFLIILISMLTITTNAQSNSILLENVTVTSCSGCLPEVIVTGYSNSQSYWDIQYYLWQLNQYYNDNNNNNNNPNTGGCDNAGGRFDQCGNCVPVGGTDCTPDPPPVDCSTNPNQCMSQVDFDTYTQAAPSTSHDVTISIQNPTAGGTVTVEDVFVWNVVAHSFVSWQVKANTKYKIEKTGPYYLSGYSYKFLEFKTLTTQYSGSNAAIESTWTWNDNAALHYIVANNTHDAQGMSKVVGTLRHKLKVITPLTVVCPLCPIFMDVVKDVDELCTGIPN
jgi:hypothetical protein